MIIKNSRSKIMFAKNHGKNYGDGDFDTFSFIASYSSK